MPLKDIQKRLVEVGRIRLGEKKVSSKGTSYPAKLTTWRLTSRSRDQLEAVAAVYGGAVREWEDGFEVVTKTDTLDVMLLPGQTLSQWYELWGQRGPKKPVECLRRCDGETELLANKSCVCSAEFGDDVEKRNEAASKGRACKPTSRLSVLLPKIGTIGHWRLETRGYFAAVELAGITDLIDRASHQGVLVPARLRIDQRESRKDGQVRKFPVPVIEAGIGDLGGVELAPVPERAALPSGRRPQEPIGEEADVITEDPIEVEGDEYEQDEFGF